ncbi:MAG: SusD/RagB family nutrient-binding outer membrane lipoprotein [Terrimonas sp.]|nr:SusD/RagB family nutrient-binding outer membrane lipoprotein [Terrimonas sp.]
MKKIFRFYLITSVFLLLASSCSKKVDDAYLNPNAPTKVPPEQLLPAVIYNIAQDLQRDNRYLSLYIQNFSYRTGSYTAERMGYFSGSDAMGDIWRNHYWLLGQNVLRMIDWAAEEQKWDYVGVGYAIMAWSWLTLTDYHGDVILKEAFNTNLLTFKYDTQEEVYAYVRELCHTAISYLERTDGASSQANLALGDGYFYNGDASKWKKFAYGVLARSFHHLTNKSNYNADSVIAYCDKSLADASDDATVKWANSGKNDEASFFGPFRGNMANFRQSQFISDLLQGANPAFNGVDDPRKWYYLRTSSNGSMKGLPLAAGETALAAADRPDNFWGGTTAVPFPPNDLNAKYVFRDNGEFPIMTASEIQFMKAEAAYKKNDKTLALAAYKKGIEYSFDMLMTRFNQNIPSGNEITATIKNNFLANPAVVPAAASSLTLAQIMLQKYISLWGFNNTETWVDLRRYHYTDIDPVTTEQVYTNFAPPTGSLLFPDNNGKPAYRVRPRYNSEYVWNIEELRRIGATDPDYHTVECWFSKP